MFSIERLVQPAKTNLFITQVKAMIQILKHFGWTWAGLLVSDDDYGIHAARSFQSDLAHSGGGCLAYLEVLPWSNDQDELRRIVDVMKKSTARVVIVFAHDSYMINLMEEVGLELQLICIFHFLFIKMKDLIRNNILACAKYIYLNKLHLFLCNVLLAGF